MLTRKHARAFAEQIKAEKKEIERKREAWDITAIAAMENTVSMMQDRIFKVLVDDNPNMDRDRFDKACEV